MRVENARIENMGNRSAVVRWQIDDHCYSAFDVGGSAVVIRSAARGWQERPRWEKAPVSPFDDAFRLEEAPALFE